MPPKDKNFVYNQKVVNALNENWSKRIKFIKHKSKSLKLKNVGDQFSDYEVSEDEQFNFRQTDCGKRKALSRAIDPDQVLLNRF